VAETSFFFGEEIEIAVTDLSLKLVCKKTVAETSFPKRVKLTDSKMSFPNLYVRVYIFGTKITFAETSFPKWVKLTVSQTSFLPHKNIRGLHEYSIF
jgi:predicted DNA-binding transcriptional regulator AlpA